MSKLVAYTVRDYTDKNTGEEKSFWSRIGTAFRNRDSSLTIVLDALPTNGKIVVRKEEPKPDPRPAPPVDNDDIPF